MAKIRAMIGSGGSQPTETTLWSNSAPTSGFSAQTVTLSDDMNNYDYLKVTYLAASGVSIVGEDIIPVSKFVSYGSGTSNASPKLTIGKTGTASGDQYIRFVTYASNTTITFSNGLKVGGNTSINACIPSAIIGIKGGITVNSH